MGRSGEMRNEIREMNETREANGSRWTRGRRTERREKADRSIGKEKQEKGEHVQQKQRTWTSKALAARCTLT